MFSKRKRDEEGIGVKVICDCGNEADFNTIDEDTGEQTTVDVQSFHLYVTARIDDAPVFKEVVHTVQQVKPANVVYQQQTALHDAIQLVERISKAALTRMTKLSTTWKLGVTPFAVRGEEEQIK